MSKHNLTEDQVIEAFCHQLGIKLRRISQEDEQHFHKLLAPLPDPICKQEKITIRKAKLKKEKYVHSY
ncbi:MAG: hypothetical protein JXA13_14870 [Anaerolineales bacterium]|nr:hypothetical protein [Anaerolineales bacterium]